MGAQPTLCPVPELSFLSRRAERDSRITCMRMLRTPPFSPPPPPLNINIQTTISANRGENPYLVFLTTFQIRLVARFFWILIYKRQFLHKTGMPINTKSVEFHQCHVNRHSIWFFFKMVHNIKDNEINLRQKLVTIENTDSDLKVHALHYANELLVRVRLSIQKLLQTRRLTCRNNTKKNVWEKSYDAHSLSIRVQTTKNHI